MNVLDIILIGIALSVDACALTICNCTLYCKSLTRKKEWAMPITFALFQGVMPLIGYFIGSIFSSYIESIAEYITAGVFFALSFKIVFDIIKEKNGKEEVKKYNEYNFAILLIQGLATSIDALFIGVTLSLQNDISVFISVSIIAVVTFLLVTCSLFFGKYLGKIFGKYAEYVGATILFALALKTLIEAII